MSLGIAVREILMFVIIVAFGISAMMFGAVAVVGSINTPLGALRHVQTGEEAPGFTLTDTTGQEISLAQMKGQVVVLIFWRPGQQRSFEALKKLESIYSAYRDKGVQILGLSDAPPEQIRQVKQTHHLSFPMLYDRDEQVYGTYGVLVTPSTLLIDQEGKMQFYYPGYRADFSDQITGRVEVLLGLKTLEQLEAELSPEKLPHLTEAEKQAQRYLRAGTRLLEKGMKRSAIRQFEKAVEANPNLMEAYLRLGELYLQQGRAQDALDAFNQVLRLKPNAEAYAGLADVFFQQGDLEQAETNLRTALKINPFLAKAHYRLGRIYEERQQIQQALKEYKTALKLLLNLEED